MGFYQSISDHYDYIFTGANLQMEFLRNYNSGIAGKSILDIGCATGELALLLANEAEKVTGIDLDPGMIKKANEKNKSKFPNLDFQKLDMLEIERDFSKESFDFISCFGNTLVHLNTKSEMLSFFKQSYKVLKNGGHIVGQIVNYDHIITHKLKSLPVIENDFIKFERNYQFNINSEIVDFKTKLRIKRTGNVIENTIGLLPILKSDLIDLLNKAGFGTVNIFGNFKKNNFSINSMALIFGARKEL